MKFVCVLRIRYGFSNSSTSSKFFFEKTLKLVLFDIHHILDNLQLQMIYFLNFIWLSSSCSIVWFTISHILLKTSSIKIIFANKNCTSACLNFSILSLFFVNEPQSLQLKTGCFKCISGTNLSPASINSLKISFIFISLKQNV